MKKLYIVVPCYNEQECLEDSASKLKAKLEELVNNNLIHKDSKIVFVNDGSKDDTWDIISSLIENNKCFIGIKLSRNKGHQNALLAGLTYSLNKSDCTISIDADLQDDIDAINQMVIDFNNGKDVVLGVRNKRKKDSFFKRFTANAFYKLIKALGVDIVNNHADFRLLSNRALEALLEYKEDNLFLRGIITQLGFNVSYVEYERKERLAGVSKYPLKKMLKLAFDGIFSFSFAPLNLILTLGTIFTFLSVVGYILCLIFINKIFEPISYFILTSIFFALGLILIGIGILGQYIGRILIETKHRPKYFIDIIKEK